MNLLREYYERAVLAAAAGILLSSSIFIWQAAARFSSQLIVMPSLPTSKGVSPMAKAEQLDAAMEKLHQPPQWTFGGRSGLFVPEKHFIGANGLPATPQTTEVHP